MTQVPAQPPRPDLPAPEHLEELLERARAMLLSDPEGALALAEEAHAAARERNDPLLIAKSLNATGFSRFMLGGLEAARRDAEEGLEFVRRAGDLATRVKLLNNLGNTCERLGDYGRGMECHLEVLSLLQEFDDQRSPAVLRSRAVALVNLGNLYMRMYEHDKALEHHLEGRRVAQRIEDPELACASTVNAAEAYGHLDRHHEAIGFAQEALALAEELDLRVYQAEALSTLAFARLGLGLREESVRDGLRAAAIAASTGEHESECRARSLLGRAYALRGEAEEAETAFARVLALAREAGLRGNERDAHEGLAGLYERRGDLRRAIDHLKEFHRLERALHNEEVARRTRFLAAQLDTERYRHEVEIERLHNAELAHANQELEAMREKLAYQAEHDPLTGLANRLLFEDRLQRAVTDARREGRAFAVLFVDLDRFKPVNDTHGHGVGDRLLRAVARRLRDGVRTSDVVARLGGDEFALILPHLNDPSDAGCVARKVVSAVREPYEVDGLRLEVTASVGIALYPRDGEDVATLQKNADTAMYRVKREGRDGVRSYDSAPQS